MHKKLTNCARPFRCSLRAVIATVTMENILPSVLSKIGRQHILLSKEQISAITCVLFRPRHDRSLTNSKRQVDCLRGSSVVLRFFAWKSEGEATASVVMIISPLLSLNRQMSKQVQDLTQRGVLAICLSNNLPFVVQESVVKAELTYIFASPEILHERRWREFSFGHWRASRRVRRCHARTYWDVGSYSEKKTVYTKQSYP